jgi:hypothetical protein
VVLGLDPSAARAAAKAIMQLLDEEEKHWLLDGELIEAA